MHPAFSTFDTQIYAYFEFICQIQRCFWYSHSNVRPKKCEIPKLELNFGIRY
ncbi:hypothetical protein D046_4661 [Vibrio parahaemolyticus V-223/04]|nr:hypothetical protein D046_4661 [Vibrio parahaemolyticus V-223/04]